MVSLVGGIIALILGILGIIKWFGLFIKGLMATLPALFILGGALAAYLGIEELREKSSSESFQDESSELKSEVENLKEEIKVLREEKKAMEKEKEKK